MGLFGKRDTVENPGDPAPEVTSVDVRVPKPTRMEVSDLHAHPENPRDITQKAEHGLRRSLKEFGDLSGIVWNRRCGFLVTGHQRLDALRAIHGEGLEIVTAQPSGDISLMIPESPDDFPIRVVDWDDLTHKAAMVAANSTAIQGTWADGLDAIVSDLSEFDPGLLTDLGFDPVADGVQPDPPPAHPPEPPGDAPTEPDDAPKDDDGWEPTEGGASLIVCPNCDHEFTQEKD